MLEMYAKYLAKKAFEEYDLNEKFVFDNIIDDADDLKYLTDDGLIKLRQEFILRIDEGVDGIVKLTDTSIPEGFVFKKVVEKIENTNYFASKIY